MKENLGREQRWCCGTDGLGQASFVRAVVQLQQLCLQPSSQLTHLGKQWLTPGSLQPTRKSQLHFLVLAVSALAVTAIQGVNQRMNHPPFPVVKTIPKFMEIAHYENLTSRQIIL